jgi:hypothetical protein
VGWAVLRDIIGVGWVLAALEELHPAGIPILAETLVGQGLITSRVVLRLMEEREAQVHHSSAGTMLAVLVVLPVQVAVVI